MTTLEAPSAGGDKPPRELSRLRHVQALRGSPVWQCVPAGPSPRRAEGEALQRGRGAGTQAAPRRAGVSRGVGGGRLYSSQGEFFTPAEPAEPPPVPSR